MLLIDQARKNERLNIVTVSLRNSFLHAHSLAELISTP